MIQPLTTQQRTDVCAHLVQRWCLKTTPPCTTFLTESVFLYLFLVLRDEWEQWRQVKVREQAILALSEALQRKEEVWWYTPRPPEGGFIL